ncbi:polysaccharide deacetylase family protein [Acetobacteraceae bacterium KSS8]|uniref:Chitooligosaccharide deacetylase n=1 Tax=Endosaccharibacter trunci TaxID=2812733 RepID=A0ABT1W9Y7_9PROT|nr:polysaccharide deacetylase family protein [Acetobacteraceae bacterium KSS8]
MTRQSTAQDVRLYGARPLDATRQKIVWPGGARMALWIAPNLEFYELDPPINPSRNPWPRVRQDLLNYGRRDYGNRVGFTRVADLLSAQGFRASVSLSVALCDHYPEIITRCAELGWELFSHGIYNTRYLYGMTEDQIREIVRDSRETIRRYSGQTLKGWLSPALSTTETTADILAEEGLLYTLDYLHDDQPTPIRVRRGRLINVPYSLSVNDVPLLAMQGVSPEEYGATLRAQFDRLYQEGERYGTVMCVPIHPYLVGQPHCIGHLETFLDYVDRFDNVWRPTASEIAEWYLANYYDDHARREFG